jgi:hypothetical protein
VSARASSFLLALMVVGRAEAAPPFLKGQLHLHSSNSGDSSTAPEAVVRWYAARGYDFIVFTDHNRVTRARGAGRMLVMPGVELTQNLATCAPPEPGHTCNLHVNALFVSARAPFAVTIPPPPTDRRLDCYLRALQVATALGGLAQLNHPNFNYGAGDAVVKELARRGVRLLEVANEAVDSSNGGDARHPSTEALWDSALTGGLTVWGVASDDAHHYEDAGAVRARGETAYTGDRGWVMVRARREAAAIREAVSRGDFYSSNGVTLARLQVDGAAMLLEVASRSSHRFTFIGPGGRVLKQSDGTSARFPLAGQHGYVRSVVTDRQGHRAWIQPARLP